MATIIAELYLGRAACPQSMNQPQQQPKLQVANGPDYREHYANSVQVRMSLWDLLLSFGTMNQTAPDVVTFQAFQGVYLSPQQAKAFAAVLQQNISQYEATFGEIRLEPKPGVPVVQ